MRLLLDTHVAVWAVDNTAMLPARIRTLIAEEAEQVFVSTIVLWEIAIKHSLGRKSAPNVSAARANMHFENAGFFVLPISMAHVLAVADLPGHHGDPFDRMLVAQALTEPMRLITHDQTLAAYSDTIITF